MLRRLSRRLEQSRDDDGFTLIELTVAMFITLLVVTSLVGVFVSSLSGVALAKQRQAATSLATGVMEQLRAVDYGTLSAGMACSDLTGNPRIVIVGTCGGGGTVTFVPGISGISEPVKVQASTPASPVPPLFPHRSTSSNDGVTYDVSAYLTLAGTAQESFDLTVLVDWTSAISDGTKTVIQRSSAYSPTRCLSSATHPFSGACQAAFRGDAGLTNASIRVINADSESAPIPGLGASEVTLGLPTLSGTVSTEQISKLSGGVATTRGSATDGTEASNGGVGTTTAADNDPSSVDQAQQTSTVTQPAITSVSKSGSAGSVRVRAGSADSGTMESRVAATTTCLDAAGTALSVAGRPCTTGSVRQSGDPASIVLDLDGASSDITLANVGAAPAPSRAVAARLTSAGSTACPTATGLGCVTAQASRALGDIRLGGLPATGTGDLPPAGWAGHVVRVSNVVESAFAESGTGARTAPGFSRSSGSLSYYDAAISGYRTVDLTTLTSTSDIALPPVTGTWTSGGKTVQITVSGSLRAGGTTLNAPSTSAPDPQCKTSACEKSASVASTLSADLVYDISVDGTAVSRFSLVTDLGAVLARSSFKAAFDA